MEDAANGIVDHYERHALSWDADRRAAAWIDQPFIERFLRFLPQGATVLDLGCGDGSPVALHMVAQGFRVTGVDSSPTLISLCRTRMPDQEWIVRDMRSEAVGAYRGDPLYHASLDASEYEALLADFGFELIEHSINDPAKGG
jgi:2-polyprenyl-3-methyl-5-hydroxy-6-metoxy-1,4-benzoquinol methylase